MTKKKPIKRKTKNITKEKKSNKLTISDYLLLLVAILILANSLIVINTVLFAQK